MTRRGKERSSWILSLGDWVSGADTSEFIVRVKLRRQVEERRIQWEWIIPADSRGAIQQAVGIFTSDAWERGQSYKM